MFKRELFNEDHEAFRDTVRRFIEHEVAPYHAKWEEDGIPLGTPGLISKSARLTRKLRDPIIAEAIGRLVATSQ